MHKAVSLHASGAGEAHPHPFPSSVGKGGKGAAGCRLGAPSAPRVFDTRQDSTLRPPRIEGANDGERRAGPAEPRLP